jgi:hypothetical protein
LVEEARILIEKMARWLPPIGVFWQQGVNVLIVWSVVVAEVGQESRQVQNPIKCP